MLLQLKTHLAENFAFMNSKKLLLAVSGGLDSMVLTHLFQQLNYEFALAHCNFQLRGLESFEDQKFVQNYANENNIKVFITQFDTEAFAKDYKLSTQVAARELRYNWFYELLEDKNFDYLLTAHHADDNLETFLINLSRGTGIDGLLGIPAENDQVIRPLLPFSRDEIATYAQENNISWREDSSNASDKYLRNKIRHDLIPVLKDLNPNFLTAFQKTQNYLQEAKVMIEDASIMVYQQVAQEIGDEIHYDLKQLTRLPNYKSYLYQWLREFGFTAWDDIYDLVGAQTGKMVFAHEFRLIKNRDFLILSSNKLLENEQFFITEDQQEVNFPLNITITAVDDYFITEKTTIFADQDKLKFPLTLRRWRQGDVFQPFGMKGQSKKISKFFKDEKLSLLEKENAWLLCSEEEIVWIVGIRQDERFKIDNSTKNKLKISLL